MMAGTTGRPRELRPGTRAAQLVLAYCDENGLTLGEFATRYADMDGRNFAQRFLSPTRPNVSLRKLRQIEERTQKRIPVQAWVEAAAEGSFLKS